MRDIIATIVVYGGMVAIAIALIVLICMMAFGGNSN